MPESMIAAISSEVPTGRRMKGSETFIAPFYRRARALPCGALLAVVGRGLRTLAVRILPTASSLRSRCRCAGAPRRLAVERGNVDVQAFAQPIGAVDHHVISSRKAGVDGGHAAVGGADADRLHRYGVVGFDHIDVRALLPVRRAALDRGGRYRDDVCQSPDQELRV